MKKLYFKYSYLILTIFLLFPLLVFSQEADNASLPEKNGCATMEVYERMKQEDPTYENNLKKIENEIQEYIKNNPQQDFRPRLITIPVVVHVVYNMSEQNISTALIQSQINVLNVHFRKLNYDVLWVPSVFQSLVADCQINFCLAVRAPDGTPTTGIVRKYTSTRSFTSNNDVKYTILGGDDAWSRNDYLNLWVCNLSGARGYAQFPGGPAATDGVVIGYEYFGPRENIVDGYRYHGGRIAIHEVGHWLGLRHIWGDDGTACTGSDLVTDTPNQAGENTGWPHLPIISCSNGPNGDMFMNYMDGTYDSFRVMFTNGQSMRMNAVLDGTRSSLLYSNKGIPFPTYQLTARNFIKTSPNTLIFDIYLLNTTVSLQYEYGSYYFNFNPNISIGGTLTYSIIGSELINTCLTPSVSGNLLKLDPSCSLLSTYISSSSPGTLIARMKLKTSASSFASGQHLNLTFNSSTRIYGYGEGDITTPSTHSIVGPDPLNRVSVNEPPVFKLSENYPNPFNPSTKINFSLPKSGLVSLKVYDISGREVADLVNETLAAGAFEYTFDGSALSSGIYFYRIQVNEFDETKQMILLK